MRLVGNGQAGSLWPLAATSQTVIYQIMPVDLMDIIHLQPGKPPASVSGDRSSLQIIVTFLLLLVIRAHVIPPHVILMLFVFSSGLCFLLQSPFLHLPTTAISPSLVYIDRLDLSLR